MLFFIVLLSINPTFGVITGGLDRCTIYNGSTIVYAPTATMCKNKLSDEICEKGLRPEGGGYPAPGNDNPRPEYCTYPSGTMYAADPPFYCPKTCGYCCETPEYSCQNPPNPEIDCTTLTKEHCESPVFAAIIKKNCPATCGMCRSNVVSCSSYIPDSYDNCWELAAHGFCTDVFWTVAQRKATCATTCKIC